MKTCEAPPEGLRRLRSASRRSAWRATASEGSTTFARPAATYFVRARGDSMAGAGVQDGDLLVVDRSLDPEDGSTVIACVDGEFTVKTYRRDKSGVRLEAANPAYPPIRFAGEMELRVFGVVTAVVHRLVPPVRPERGSHAASRTWDLRPETRDPR